MLDVKMYKLMIFESNLSVQKVIVSKNKVLKNLANTQFCAYNLNGISCSLVLSSFNKSIYFRVEHLLLVCQFQNLLLGQNIENVNKRRKPFFFLFLAHNQISFRIILKIKTD